MGRPQIRTAVMNPDKRWAIKHLFGTVRNAWNRLRLDQGGVPLLTLKRALSGYPVEPEQRLKIEDHWDSWVRYFIQRDVRGRFHDLSAIVPLDKIMLIESAKSYDDYQHSDIALAWFAAHPDRPALPDDETEVAAWWAAQQQEKDDAQHR